jgi:hypothetical protein
MPTIKSTINKLSKDKTLVQIRMIIAGMPDMGIPTFTTCTIECERVDYFLGSYYDMAEAYAKKNGYVGPFLSWDEFEAPDWLYRQFYGDSPRSEPPLPVTISLV